MLLTIAGCSGVRTADLPVPSSAGTTQAPEPPVAQPVASSFNAPTMSSPPTPRTLAQQLADPQGAAATPTFRWPTPAPGQSYEPLSNGLLLVHPDYLDKQAPARPFVITAQDVDGRLVWTAPFSVSTSAIRYLTLSSNQERIAVIERSGRVRVLETRTGKEIADMQVEPDAHAVSLIDQGRRLAVTFQTPIGIFRYGIGVFPVADGSPKPLYGVNGSEVFASPHHGLLLGVVPDGVEVVGPSGSLGMVDGTLPQRGSRLHISGDGKWIFVWGAEKAALHIYSADLKPVGRPIPARYSDLEFPSSASLYHDGGTVVFMDGGRQSLEYDRQQWHRNEVLPGGEALLTSQSTERQECVVTPQGRLFGCATWFSWHRNGERTFLWHADDRWVSAYQL